MEQTVFQNVDTKFRHWEITQKKEYNIQNKAKVWNQEESAMLMTTYYLQNVCLSDYSCKI
jgi:hypothetical protein